MKTFQSVLGRAALFVLIMTIICGIIYTGFITAASQIVFADQANGSIIEIEGKKYGCELLGQQFNDKNHLWGRITNVDISTYTDKDGNTLAYAAPSNLSPASKEYEMVIAERVEKIKKEHPEKEGIAIPVDLVTCSGSGLDPEISYAAAEYQIERLAKNNNKTIEEIKKIIDQCTTDKIFGIFGEKTVNVLKVNLMLEGILK